MNIKNLPVDNIDAADRLRTVNPFYVDEIKASFDLRGGEGKGQLTPIEVRPGATGRYRLISGAHRLAAARESGWKTIAAIVSDVTNDEARLREIDENLVRHDLSAMDRAFFVAEREKIWNHLHPDKKGRKLGASARWHATEIISVASSSAEKLGVSERTVRNWLDLAEKLKGIEPDIRERIAKTDLADRQKDLKALAAMGSAGERQRVLDLLLSDGKDRPKNVAAALARLSNRLEDHTSPGRSRFDKFVVFWTKSSEETRDLIRDYVTTGDGKKVKKRRAPQGGAI